MRSMTPSHGYYCRGVLPNGQLPDPAPIVQVYIQSLCSYPQNDNRPLVYIDYYLKRYYVMEQVLLSNEVRITVHGFHNTSHRATKEKNQDDR